MLGENMSDYGEFILKIKAKFIRLKINVYLNVFNITKLMFNF